MATEHPTPSAGSTRAVHRGRRATGADAAAQTPPNKARKRTARATTGGPSAPPADAGQSGPAPIPTRAVHRGRRLAGANAAVPMLPNEAHTPTADETGAVVVRGWGKLIPSPQSEDECTSPSTSPPTVHYRRRHKRDPGYVLTDWRRRSSSPSDMEQCMWSLEHVNGTTDI
jgi:hypothetical protein